MAAEGEAWRQEMRETQEWHTKNLEEYLSKKTPADVEAARAEAAALAANAKAAKQSLAALAIPVPPKGPATRSKLGAEERYPEPDVRAVDAVSMGDIVTELFYLSQSSSLLTRRLLVETFLEEHLASGQPACLDGTDKIDYQFGLPFHAVEMDESAYLAAMFVVQYGWCFTAYYGLDFECDANPAPAVIYVKMRLWEPAPDAVDAFNSYSLPKFWRRERATVEEALYIGRLLKYFYPAAELRVTKLKVSKYGYDICHDGAYPRKLLAASPSLATVKQQLQASGLFTFRRMIPLAPGAVVPCPEAGQPATSMEALQAFGLTSP